MSMLRIGVNLSWVGPGAKPAAVHAVTSALQHLAAHPASGIEPVLFGTSTLAESHPQLVAALESHLVPVPGHVRVFRVGAEYTWLPWSMGKLHLDAVHDAGGTSPGSVDVPRILTVDDLSPIEQPRGFNPLRTAYHRRVVPRAVAAATSVVVPSEFVRARLVDHFGADPAKVHIVPRPLPPHPDPTPIDTVRARHGIIGQIILLPAATHAHEEHVVAVRAMQHLASRHKETTLVLYGAAGRSEGRVQHEIAERGLDARVVRITDDRPALRSALYEHAAAVVYPAVYGGFASAVLEAMACGVPVVVADAGAAPELVGDAGAVIPPGDDAQLAIELHRILDDAEWRRRRVDDGLDRARAYTVERSAEALVAAYRSVMAAL